MGTTKDYWNVSALAVTPLEPLLVLQERSSSLVWGKDAGSKSGFHRQRVDDGGCISADFYLEMLLGAGELWVGSCGALGINYDPLGY